MNFEEKKNKREKFQETIESVTNPIKKITKIEEKPFLR